LHSQVKLGGFLVLYFRLWSTSSANLMLSGWSACKWDCKCNIFNALIMNNIKEQVTWIMVQLQFSLVHFSNCCKLRIDYFFNSQTTSVIPQSLTVTTVRLAIYLVLPTGVKSGLLPCGNRVVWGCHKIRSPLKDGENSTVKSFVSCTFAQYDLGYEIQEDRVGGVCETPCEMSTRLESEYHKERDNFWDRVRYTLWAWVGFSWLRTEGIGGCLCLRVSYSDSNFLTGPLAVHGHVHK